VEQRAGLSSKRHRLLERRTEVLGFFRSHIRRDALGLRKIGSFSKSSSGKRCTLL
jgi:hypothetical protein